MNYTEIFSQLKEYNPRGRADLLGLAVTIINLIFGDSEVECSNHESATTSPTYQEISMDLTNQEVSRIAWEAIATLNEESKEDTVLDAEHTQRYLDLMKATTSAQEPCEYYAEDNPHVSLLDNGGINDNNSISLSANSNQSETIIYGDRIDGTNGEVECSNHESATTSPTYQEISMDLTNQEVSRIAWEAIANLNEENTVLILDAEFTQRYLDPIKATTSAQEPTNYADNIVVVNESGDTENAQEIGDGELCAIQCSNCEQVFDEADFMEHICDFDDNKVFIKDDDEVECSTVEEIKEPPCIRQLRENNARIRKFLKDELKIDFGGPTKKQDGPHECTMCERKFVRASGLVRHLEKHALDLIPVTTNTNHSGRHKVVIKCLICGRILFNAGEGLNHLMDSHEKRLDSEDELETIEGVEIITSEKIASVLLLDSNELSCMQDGRKSKLLKFIISDSILQCEFCDYSFSEVSHLLLHEASHDPLRGFECSSCGINVRTSKEIFSHWQAKCAKDESRANVHLQKYFVCNVCENKFSSHEQLYNHRYSSSHLFPRLNETLGILQIGCECCGTFHENAEAIMRHHEENHMKKVKVEHTAKYRQYLCHVCGKSFTQSSHLWQHLRFHSGVQPFACNELGCSRRFTIRPDLNDHIRKCHTGERPYHCDLCDKRFLTGSVRNKHRLTHREGKHGCEECGKRFRRADALKKHKRIHCNENLRRVVGPAAA